MLTKTTIIITIILTFFCLNGICQGNNFEKPDYKKIQNEIQDSASRFYYPKLLSRLQAFDATLDIEDFRHLYYGYVFQKEYRPYMVSSYDEKLLKYYINQSAGFTFAENDTIIQLVNNSLAEFPFNIRALGFVSYIYFSNGDKEMAQKTAHLYRGIIHTIMSSGNGITCETAMHVISVEHEYVMLKLFNFQTKSQSFDGTCDYLEVAEKEKGIEGLYFNVEKLFEKNRQIMNTLAEDHLSDSKADSKPKKKKDKKKKKSKKHSN